MNIVIKNKSGTQFELIDKTSPQFVIKRKQALKPAEFDTQLLHLSAAVPDSWRALWSSIKTPNKPSFISDFSAKNGLMQLLKNKQLLAVPHNGVLPQSVTNNNRLAASSSSGKRSTHKDLSDFAQESPTPEDFGHSQPPPAASKKKPPIDNIEPASISPDATTGAAPIAATETRGCPISMVSGEELLMLEDFTLPGPVPFTWQRTYRSGNPNNIGLGHGWTHSASDKIHLNNGQLNYYDEEGRCIPLQCPDVGQESRYIPEGFTLLRPNKQSFLLRKDGTNDKVFTVVGRQASVYHLTQIRHSQYRPGEDRYTPSTGFALQLGYNSQGQLSRLKNNSGKTLQFLRNACGQIQQILLKNEASQQEKILAEYDYNDELDLTAHRNANGVGERYQYHNHLLAQRTLITGFNYYYQWDNTDHTARCLKNWGDNGIYHYQFEWDPDNNTSQATDSHGYTSIFKYNEYGQLTEMFDNEGARHQYHYENGRRVEAINPLGHKTSYFYNEGRFSRECDPLNQTEGYRYFNNQLTGYHNKEGASWKFEYNQRKQRIASIDQHKQRTHYSYNKQGLLASETAPDGKKQSYRWDQNGELKSITDPQGHTRKFHYNDWGEVVASELRLKGQILAGITCYEYSPTGKLKSIKAPNGSTIHYQYNENDQLTKHSDANGRITEFEYDGLSQVVKRTNPEGHTLNYQYDKERNLTGLINENGERYQFFYDGNERLIKETGFDGRVQEYEYNIGGQLIKHRDGDIETEFERDPLGRMVSKISRSPGEPDTPIEKSRFAYKNNQLIETYNNQHYLAFEYNSNGGLAKEHHSRINHKKERIKRSFRDIVYQNQWPNHRNQMTLPDQQVVNYQYNDNYQLSAVIHNGELITEIAHDDFGREIKRQQGQLNTQTDYDPMGRLHKQQALQQRNKETRIQREYGYDQFGNINHIEDGQVETRYVYDLLSRLTRSERQAQNESQQEVFHFDPAGNLLDSRRQSQAENPAGGNRLHIQGDKKFFYDQRGNLILEKRGKDGKLTTHYYYNLQNQLIKVEKQGQVTEYNYDPLGRRREKVDNFGTTTYLWSGDQMVQEERNQIKKTYIYEPDSFKPVAMVEGEKVYHYHLDHLGTPQELSDNEGNIVWQARYKTYGNVAKKAIEEVENNLRFQGQYFDEESGLHYNRHRYYNPNTGTFTTQDPIGLLGGVNNYQYAPNPVSWIDPFGLSCKEGEGEKELQLYWPLNYGAIGKVNKEKLQPGTIIDRYGHEGGTFVSPANIPFEMRALPPTTDMSSLNTYKIMKPINSETAIIAPAFNQIGLGVQHKLSEPVGTLVKSGHLKRINN